MTTDERLEILERELAGAKRRMRWLLWGTGLAVVVAGLAAALTQGMPAALAQDSGAVPKEVRANRFVVEDAAGKARAVLGMTEEGRPAVALADVNGLMRVSLGMGKEGPGLKLRDENGKERAVLGVVKDGPGLLLIDEKGKTRAGVHLDKDGPALMLIDENGKPRAVVGAGTAQGADGRTITYPESSLRLIGKDGKGIWQAP